MDLPIPGVGAGEVRRGVRAATVNPVDAPVRRGRAFISGAEPPYVPGMEPTGVVDEIGEGADTELTVGERVMALVVVSGTYGAYAEYLVVPADSVVRAPPRENRSLHGRGRRGLHCRVRPADPRERAGQGPSTALPAPSRVGPRRRSSAFLVSRESLTRGVPAVPPPHIDQAVTSKAWTIVTRPGSS
ncbi:alcohol dehydrogenase catalytic domain-containing protein [Streptomyces sp. NPDC047046]|uniref:alcohol dehydrogenase catalytic domain-containing protein n=1 Tax=Streptomyces sp. NPDC047046 TaxID=3155378 RepID=UPI00340F8E9D